MSALERLYSGLLSSKNGYYNIWLTEVEGARAGSLDIPALALEFRPIVTLSGPLLGLSTSDVLRLKIF